MTTNLKKYAARDLTQAHGKVNRAIQALREIQHGGLLLECQDDIICLEEYRDAIAVEVAVRVNKRKAGGK